MGMKPVKKTIELAALPTRENTRVNGGEVRPARIQLVVRMSSASASASAPASASASSQEYTY